MATYTGDYGDPEAATTVTVINPDGSATAATVDGYGYAGMTLADDGTAYQVAAVGDGTADNPHLTNILILHSDNRASVVTLDGQAQANPLSAGESIYQVIGTGSAENLGTRVVHIGIAPVGGEADNSAAGPAQTLAASSTSVFSAAAAAPTPTDGRNVVTVRGSRNVVTVIGSRNHAFVWGDDNDLTLFSNDGRTRNRVVGDRNGTNAYAADGTALVSFVGDDSDGGSLATGGSRARSTVRGNSSHTMVTAENGSVARAAIRRRRRHSRRNRQRGRLCESRHPRRQ